MITRTSNNLVIEGFVASPQTKGGLPRRIEIDGSSGLIRSVGEARGSADLALGDDYTIFPGFIDLHVHAREDPSSSQSYKENFQSAGQAAIHGGVTVFVDMPNNPWPPVDDSSYLAKRELAKTCPVDVLLYAGIGPRTRPLSFPVPYKVYMGHSVGDLFMESEEDLRKALARYRGQKVAFHAEAPEVLSQSKNASTHAERRPAQAEIQAIETALRLSESFQIEPHICHLSTEGGMDIIRAARQRGARVTCEVTPHHLFFDQDNVANFTQPSFLQCNPPIRSRLDRIALLEALRSGEIDYLATDHAPHSLEEKEAGTSGIPHLDTYGAFVFWLLEEGISLGTILQACAEGPGKFLSRYLPHPYGKVEKGFVGSLSVLRRESQTIRRSSLKTRSGWSCFEGSTFPGRVTHTIVRGRIYPQIDE
jgi:dihydroorotase